MRKTNEKTRGISLPFSNVLEKQCKELSGIFNCAHAVPRDLSIVLVVTGSQTVAIVRVVTSPFLGKYVPDVNTKDVLHFQNIHAADVLWEMTKTKN